MSTFSQAARYYDRIYADKDYAGEVLRLISLLELGPVTQHPTLLDVACGTGRHLEHLSGHFRVEGLDLCPELLELARERLPGTIFHEGDLVRFELGKTFDVVTCLFSSIGYVHAPEELEQAVRCLAAHVKPGGVLVVEPWFTPDQWHPNTVHGLYVDEPELKLARINTSHTRGRLSVMDLHYLIGTPAGTEHVVERHELQLLDVEELTAVFEQAGLRVRYDAEGLTGRGLYLCRREA